MVAKYDGIHYAKQYLNQAIFRMDFSSPLDTNAVFSNNIIDAITDGFPRPGIEQLIKYGGGLEIDINNGSAKSLGAGEEGREKTYTDNSLKTKQHYQICT